MEDKKIWSFFRKAKRKVVRNILLQNVILFTIVGLLAGTGIHVLALFLPIYGSLYWGMVAVGVAMALGGIYTLIRCPKNREIALIVDSKGLDEQLVTSMELKGKEDLISSLQKQKTIESISSFSIKEKLPYKWSLTNMLLLAFSTLAFVVAAIMPSEAKGQAVALHELEKVVKEEEKKVEEAKKEVEELDKVSEAKLAELQKILEESLKEMKESEGEKDLEKAKERMETKLEKELEKQDSTLSSQISEILEKKNLIKKTEEEKEQEKQEEELQKQLEQLKQQLASAQNQEQNGQSEGNGQDGKSKEENKKNGNKDGAENGNNEEGNQGSQNDSDALMELSEQLQQAANNGQLSAGEMQQLAQSIAQANAALANSTLSNQQLQALSGQMSQTLASSGSTGVSGAATPSMGNSSGSNDPGSNGNGSQGNASNGNGSGNGSGSGTGNGSGNGTGGGGYNYGSKNGVEKEYVKNTSEEVTIPENVGDDKNLTGQSAGNGTTYSQKMKNGPAWAGNSVNYSQVVGDYANQAYSNVENNKVPDAMKEVVKSYFEGLTN